MTLRAIREARRSQRYRWMVLCLLCAPVTMFVSSTQAQDIQREIRIGVSRPGGGYTVQAFPLEIYIARVLAGEAARDSRPAALEALAITIRTFALANRGRHSADGFDLCDTTHCQVMRTPNAAHERAAAATAGNVLLRGGAPATVFYSASCGGQTEIPSAVWPGHEDPPYMPSQPDDACMGAPAWTAEIEGADLTRALRAAGFRGDRLRDFRILSRDVSGRVARLRVAGFAPEEISGQDLRSVVGRTLGWQFIKSAAFELERIGDTYHFEGHGSGHGVGLCVIGSVNLAVAGRTATEILNRYFPGLEIGPPVTLTLPGDLARGLAGRHGCRRTPVSSAAACSGRCSAGESSHDVLPRARSLLPCRTRMRASASQSRCWPTSHALTSRGRWPCPRRPAWSSVFTRPRRVTSARPASPGSRRAPSSAANCRHLLPLAVLRERGVLERTIRHELVHVMADPLLRDRAAWVREGAAVYFAGRRPIPAANLSRRPTGSRGCRAHPTSIYSGRCRLVR